jgi:ubiquinone/menaquinone biosynthesis C-methylase UbiE
MELSPIVVCPESLGPLTVRDDELWSATARRAYPIRQGIAFFGFPERDHAMIAATMEEEHAWQGTADTVARDLEFLRDSAPAAVDLLNLASGYVNHGSGQPKALELGAGSGWVSWLLASAGYDTWMVDFEANSVAIGLQYEHRNLGAGRRFVCDARYAPFADESFDLVLLKEFVHHVADYDLLFAEASRVLRTGGIVALMEPTRSVLQTLLELRTPDPHAGHVITWLDNYRRSLRRNGFVLEHQTAVYQPRENRVALLGRLKHRAQRSVQGLARPDAFTQAHLRLIGDASSVLIARKSSPAPRVQRPRMRVIDPSTLVITDQEREAFRSMIGVLGDAAQRLRPVAPAMPATA